MRVFNPGLGMGLLRLGRGLALRRRQEAAAGPDSPAFTAPSNCYYRRNNFAMTDLDEMANS